MDISDACDQRIRQELRSAELQHAQDDLGVSRFVPWFLLPGFDFQRVGKVHQLFRRHLSSGNRQIRAYWHNGAFVNKLLTRLREFAQWP